MRRLRTAIREEVRERVYDVVVDHAYTVVDDILASCIVVNIDCHTPKGGNL